jgi:hypothetical protein
MILSLLQSLHSIPLSTFHSSSVFFPTPFFFVVISHSILLYYFLTPFFLQYLALHPVALSYTISKLTPFLWYTYFFTPFLRYFPLNLMLYFTPPFLLYFSLQFFCSTGLLYPCSTLFLCCILSHSFSCTAKNQYRKFETNLPRKLRGHTAHFHIYVPVSIYIFPRSICLFCCRKFVVDRSWKYINRSQTHECGNWD